MSELVNNHHSNRRIRLLIFYLILYNPSVINRKIFTSFNDRNHSFYKYMDNNNLLYQRGMKGKFNNILLIIINKIT